MLPRHTQILSPPHRHHGSVTRGREGRGMGLVTEPAMSVGGLNIHVQEKGTVDRTEMAPSFTLKSKGGRRTQADHERVKYIV